MSDSPAWSRHLMTVEAGPADEMNPDAPGCVFVSRCICSWDSPWGPYAQTMAAVEEHLLGAGLVRPADAETSRDRELDSLRRENDHIRNQLAALEGVSPC